jgi:hypothetical protein
VSGARVGVNVQLHLAENPRLVEVWVMVRLIYARRR